MTTPLRTRRGACPSAGALENLGAHDAVEAERTALLEREIQRFEACFVPIHVHLQDTNGALGLQVVAVDVSDGERLLLEPRALDGGTHALLAGEAGHAEERELAQPSEQITLGRGRE